MLIVLRERPKSVIIHSDRGVQYCSKEYQFLLADRAKFGTGDQVKLDHSLLWVERLRLNSQWRQLKGF